MQENEAKFNLQQKLYQFHREHVRNPQAMEEGNSSFSSMENVPGFRGNASRINSQKDLDCISMILDPLIDKTIKRSSRIARWSHYYRAIDIILRLIVVFIGLIVSVLSFINGSLNETILSYIIGCVALVVVSIGELREVFHFTKRTTVLRSCHYQLESYVRKLRTVAVSGKDAVQIIEDIDQISKKIDKIDARAFNIDFTQNKRKSLQISWNSSNPNTAAESVENDNSSGASN